jgi:ATP-dependent helicase HrpA
MTREGLRKLLEIQLRYDLGWLEKDLRSLRMLGTLAVTLVTPDDLQKQAFETIQRWVTDPFRLTAAATDAARAHPLDFSSQLKAAKFTGALEKAKQDLRGLVPKLGDWLKEIFSLRLALETNKQPYPGMAEDLAALLPGDFLRQTPFDRVQHLSRYLRGMQVRAERWKRDAGRDTARAKELAPFAGASRKLAAELSAARKDARTEKAGVVELKEEFRWAVEEFRISLFAQELGTAGPVSAVRLQKTFEEIGGGVVPPSSGEPVARVMPATAPKKGTPLKSLGSLDQLFRK